MNRYLEDRATAPADLIMIYEDIPYTAVDWITAHPSDVEWILEQVRSTIAFLQARDIVHFDVDLFNVVTDGSQAMISDHGLVMDAAFDLSDTERRFLTANRHFDDGNVVLSLGHQLYWMYRSRPDDVRHLIDREAGLDGNSFESDVVCLLDAVEELDENGLLPTGPILRDLLAKYRDVIAFMHDFFTSAREHWSSDTLLDDQRLAGLLGA